MLTHIVKKCFSGVFALFFILASNPVLAQEEFFHEIVLEKALIEKEEWEFFGEANFKYLYDEAAWRRWGLSFGGVRNIERLNISGGVNTYYTFNRSIVNFFEVRPWSAIQYNIPIGGKFPLRHRLKYEWRFFYTENSNSTREGYGRLRYQISIDIPVLIEEESLWKIRPYFEWFIIRDPATFERFPNERDYGIRIIRRIKDEQEIYIKYRLEEFYNTNTHRENGHIFLIGYSF